MHELAVMAGIIDVVSQYAKAQNAKKILDIRLTVGALRDFQEVWVRHYFEKFSRGTLAEGATITRAIQPIRFRCKACEHSTEMGREAFINTPTATCEQCGSAELVLCSGSQLMIDGIEVQL